MAVRAYGKSVATYTDWSATTPYLLNVYVRPTTPNGYCYRCTQAGTSGLAEPAWIPEVGATVTDGDVVWVCEDYASAPNPLTVELDTRDFGGCPMKDIWVKSDTVENQDFVVYGSYDGVSWRQLDELSVPHGGRDNRHKGLQNAYPFTKVSTEVSANNEIEIVAGE